MRANCSNYLVATILIGKQHVKKKKTKKRKKKRKKKLHIANRIATLNVLYF